MSSWLRSMISMSADSPEPRKHGEPEKRGNLRCLNAERLNGRASTCKTDMRTFSYNPGAGHFVASAKETAA